MDWHIRSMADGFSAILVKSEYVYFLYIKYFKFAFVSSQQL